MFNACIFRPSEAHERASDAEPTDGLLALRHIAGAALDVVEHRGGRIEIFDSVIRGLAVTSRDEGSGENCFAELRLDVLTAVMAGTWFDSKVRGVARFRNCVVTQLVSLSPAEQLTIEADLIAHDDIPVAAIADSAALTEAFRSVSPGVIPPWIAFEAMGYRSQPAKAELDRSTG